MISLCIFKYDICANFCILYVFFFRERKSRGWGKTQRERKRILYRLQAQHKAQCRAWSHDLKSWLGAEIKSGTFNSLSHPGTPVFVFCINGSICYTSCSIDLLKLNPLDFCFFGKCISLFLFLKWHSSMLYNFIFFTFISLKVWFISLVPIASDQMSVILFFYYWFPNLICPSPSIFRVSLSLAFRSCPFICLNLIFFAFVLLEVYWTPWNHEYMSITKNRLYHYLLKYFSFPTLPSFMKALCRKRLTCQNWGAQNLYITMNSLLQGCSLLTLGDQL